LRPLAEDDHGHDTGRPAGEFFRQRNQFYDKGRQQQEVKSQEPGGQHGSDQVYGRVNEHPFERTEQAQAKLQDVGPDRHQQGQHNAYAREARRTEPARQGWDHGLSERTHHSTLPPVEKGASWQGRNPRRRSG